MTSREHIGAAIIFLWLIGIAALVRRELVVSEPEQMAEAALKVVPGSAYYAVMSGDTQIGWASSSIDTSLAGISVRDVLVLDTPDSAGKNFKRFAARSHATLTPGLRLTSFSYELGGDHAPMVASGTMSHDTALSIVTRAGKSSADSQTIAVHKTVFWPTTVPLALALAARPKIGRIYSYSIYDPTTAAAKDVSLIVGAESLFVIPDSVRMDERTGSWAVAHSDTVRGWKLVPQGESPLNGWIDERGRVIESAPTGTFTLKRTAYELAFRNWELDAKKRTAAAHEHHLMATP